eukprot:TRINITY_DN25451_c0_g1_i1.p1 TRINITY_DN25451_c0_g1~~TRINITY_DN25451_c0_g1_i1.p1  ORF type:complete len:396 (+),score=113.58 TRINITY_DN25451_c0_g1_i1:102-1289(+)
MARRRATGTDSHAGSQANEMRWLGGSGPNTDTRLSIRPDEPTEPCKVFFQGKEEGAEFWFPGETVAGQLRHRPGLLQEGAAPRLTFDGSCRVERTGEIGMGEPDSITPVCSIDVAIKGELERNPDTPDTFRFKFTIPAQASEGIDLPPSCKFEGDTFWLVEIKYTLVVAFPSATRETVEIPMKVRTAFTAEKEAELPVEHDGECESAQKSFCCWTRGTMRARIVMARNLCISGAAVPTKLFVHNRSPMKVRGIKFNIEARFWATHGIDRRNDTVPLGEVRLERELIPPGDKDTETEQKVEVTLRLPHKAPPTFTFADRVGVTHWVTCEPLYSTAFFVEAEYPVTLALSELMRNQLESGGGGEDAESRTTASEADPADVRVYEAEGGSEGSAPPAA